MTINVKISVTSAPADKALRVEQSYGDTRVLASGDSVDLVVHDANDIKLSETAVETTAVPTPEEWKAPTAETETAGATGTD